MISGVWANSNLDDGKDTRQRFLADIERIYQETLHDIYNTDKIDKQAEIDFKSNPFYSAMKVPGEDLMPSNSQSLPTTTIEKPKVEIDQS